jgi:hypothetical protein
MKPNTMWGNKMEVRLRRYSPTRMISEDRMTLQNVGPHGFRIDRDGHAVAPFPFAYHLALRHDGEAVDVQTWFSRRREQPGWHRGARVYKR